MNARDYVAYHSTSAPAIPGVPSSPAPVPVTAGDTVGVVCLCPGGPSSLDDVSRFLYDLYMDPARLDLGMGGFVRHLYARLMANLRASSVRERYEMIGGRSPLLQLAGEQSGALERHLNRAFTDGVDFRAYVAHRHGSPSFEDAAQRMQDDGVDRVVLLPMAPHYATARARSWIRYWETLERTGHIPAWPRTAIHEYAANPKLVQAVSERIDQAMQRFPKSVRPDIHLLFTASGLPPSDRDRRCDRSCCLATRTVDHVMQHRDDDRGFSIAFQSEVGPALALAPSVRREADRLVEEGCRGVLLVPVSFVADRLETCVDLDIDLREHLSRAGVDHVEVTSGLNTHPLFIEALAEAVVSQCRLPESLSRYRVQGDGAPADYPLAPLRDLMTESVEDRSVLCPACSGSLRARAWGETAPQHVAPRRTPQPIPMTPVPTESSLSS